MDLIAHKHTHRKIHLVSQCIIILDFSLLCLADTFRNAHTDQLNIDLYFLSSFKCGELDGSAKPLRSNSSATQNIETNRVKYIPIKSITTIWQVQNNFHPARRHRFKEFNSARVVKPELAASQSIYLYILLPVCERGLRFCNRISAMRAAHESPLLTFVVAKSDWSLPLSPRVIVFLLQAEICLHACDEWVKRHTLINLFICAFDLPFIFPSR